MGARLKLGKGNAMQIDLIHLLAALEKQAELYDGGSDTHASYLEGKIDLLKDLIKLGFKVGA